MTNCNRRIILQSDWSRTFFKKSSREFTGFTQGVEKKCAPGLALHFLFADHHHTFFLTSVDAPLSHTAFLKQNIVQNMPETTPIPLEFDLTDDDAFIDMLASMSDDMFSENGSLSPTSSIPQGDDVHELSQAYEQLRITDFAVDLDSQDSFTLHDTLFNDKDKFDLDSIFSGTTDFPNLDDLLKDDLPLNIDDDCHIPLIPSASDLPLNIDDDCHIPLIASASEVRKPKESRKVNKSPKVKKKTSKKKKSRKRKRKLKSDTRTLGEQRRTKWRRGNNDEKMKKGVYQVRIERRKIRVVAEEQGLNERALRRYVHISMDPTKQNSGYYIPLQAEEKVPKCMMKIVNRC